MSLLQINAEALYAELRQGVRGLLQPDSALVGIWSGGAWLAERLARDLGLKTRPGSFPAACTATILGPVGWRSGPIRPTCLLPSTAATSS